MRTVLVIDDSELIRLAATVGLSASGWTVLTAESGREGVALAAREAPDVVLLDLVMPDLDGAQTLQALRAQAQTRETPVVFLTARADRAPAGSEGERGAAGVIEKPFAPAQLGDALMALLGWTA